MFLYSKLATIDNLNYNVQGFFLLYVFFCLLINAFYLFILFLCILLFIHSVFELEFSLISIDA